MAQAEEIVVLIHLVCLNLLSAQLIILVPLILKYIIMFQGKFVSIQQELQVISILFDVENV